MQKWSAFPVWTSHYSFTGQVKGKESFGFPEVANKSAMITGAILRQPNLVTPALMHDNLFDGETFAQLSKQISKGAIR